MHERHDIIANIFTALANGNVDGPPLDILRTGVMAPMVYKHKPGKLCSRSG